MSMAALATPPITTDQSIREGVIIELKYDPKITSSDIAVAVKDGVVTLSGYVSSYWEKDEAEKAAKRVYGVRGVANDIEVKLPATWETRKTSSRRPLIASATHSSARPDKYISAVSMWVMPSSRPCRNAAIAESRSSFSSYQVP
jgi:hypothetical protein